MSWKVRHEGSPTVIEGLSPQQIVDGMQEGQWETTDEVMGPGESKWTPIERHPQFEEAALDIEAKPPNVQPDESHVDMNALIDVCMVLLVFYILTTAYVALQSMLEHPDTGNKAKGAVVVQQDQVDKTMIKVRISTEGGKPVFRVEDKVVPQEKLADELSRSASQSSKRIVLLEIDEGTSHGSVIAVQDAAKGAGVTKVNYVVD